MMPRLAPLALVLCCAAASVAAQDPTPDPAAPPPANLAYIEGAVELVIDGLSERADPPMLLLDGDLVRTRNGRAEIVFADGSLLHLDVDSELEMLAAERLRLLRGRALLRVSVAASRPYVIDTPAASVRFDSSGEYRLTAGQANADLEVGVIRGRAEIDDGTRRAALRSGEMVSLARAGARPLFQAFNTAHFDAFAAWSDQRTRGFTGAQSAAQLPYELRPYGTVFDQHGRWDYVAPHGYVWFPSVAAGWRPYYDGAWNHTRYGWTWYGRDRWAWPTHHFGRWGYNGAFWYWIPTNVWGPAWVSWGVAPGYVSWCPLGWDGLPVIGFGVGYPGYAHAGYAFNPWRAWTVVPRSHFGFRRPVRVHAVDGGRLDPIVRTALSAQPTSPDSRGAFAVTRGSVSTPGASGAARRLEPDVDRRGSVRRPREVDAAAAPAPSAVDRSGAVGRSLPEAPASDGRRAVRSRDPRTADQPWTPPAVRRAPESMPTPADGDRSARPGDVRGAQPRGETARADGPRGGAVRDGAAARDGGSARSGSAGDGGARTTGGARPRGGSVGAPAQGSGGGSTQGSGGGSASGSSGRPSGAVRRPPR